MSHVRSRRSLLSAATGLLAGAAGCLFGGSDDGATTTTQPTGRAYSFEVENRIESDDLSAAGLDPSAPAVVLMEAELTRRDGEDEVLYDGQVEVTPTSTRTVENAFRTQPGNSYLAKVELQRFREEGRGSNRAYLDNTRFQPGDFAAPESDTFQVTVDNEPLEGRPFRPQINML